jgi:hypothetical protein
MESAFLQKMEQRLSPAPTAGRACLKTNTFLPLKEPREVRRAPRHSEASDSVPLIFHSKSQRI